MMLKSTFSKRQKGAILMLVALGLVVLLGVAAIAIDLSHGYTNKTRLQNLVDSLALSAAVSLKNQEKSSSATPANDVEATAEYYARTNTLTKFADSTDTSNQKGNKELTDAIASGDLALTFTFSTTLGTTWSAANAINNAQFVRVEATNPMNIATWFARVMGINNMTVSASAVAGTAPIAPCNLSPLMLCADLASTDTNCKDDGQCYGYTLGNIYCLTPAGSGGSNFKCAASGKSNTQWGPGNIGFVDLGSVLGISPGANTLRDAFAKDPSLQQYCQNFKTVTELPGKTGNNWGPVKTGVESLFDDSVISGFFSDTITGLTSNGLITNSAGQSSSLTYLDWSKLNGLSSPALSTLSGGTQQIPISGVPGSFLTSNGVPDPYSVYQTFESSRETSIPASSSVFGQRIMNIAIVNCSNPPNGSSGTNPVLGFTCFFLTAEYQKQGSEEFLLGELIYDPARCQSTGNPTSTGNYGFYKVQLYKDPLGGHS